MTFQCFVGTYEIKSADELRAQYGQDPFKARKALGLGDYAISDMERLFLRQTSPAKKVLVKRKTLEEAVGLLLKTDVSKLDADGVSKFKRNVLAIAKNIGALESDDDTIGSLEDLSIWVMAAEGVQDLFSARSGQRPDTEIDAGCLDINFSYQSGRASIDLRPPNAINALLYCAAQMVARGITGQSCDHCKTLFLGGGERGRNKKRAGSRFCSDTCRYEFHNELRRKTKRKSK
jgi:hypothetical protein